MERSPKKIHFLPNESLCMACMLNDRLHNSLTLHSHQNSKLHHSTTDHQTKHHCKCTSTPWSVSNKQFEAYTCIFFVHCFTKSGRCCHFSCRKCTACEEKSKPFYLIQNPGARGLLYFHRKKIVVLT